MNMIANNLIALFLTFGLSLTWLRLNDYAAHRRWIDSRTSRKIIHISTGPLFVLCWLLFSDGDYARYLAAMVPLLITLQFALVGLGVWDDPAAVKAMSRSGDRREILRGPLFYGIVFVLLTIIYWKDSPIGITALMILCGGDGIADIVGRRWGRGTLPWNSYKTWIGSLGVFLGGWVFATIILLIYTLAGVFPNPVVSYFPAVTIIAFAGALVESLPLHDVDNLTITFSSLLLGHILF